MSDPSGFEIVTAGWSCVQDLGRTGQSQFGVARGGAADQYGARCANALVANPPSYPLIETTAREFALVARTDALLAVTGAPCQLTVDGVPAPTWQPIAVPAGARVALGRPGPGLHCYLAVHGRLDVPTVLGSVAPDPALGAGRTLADGDRLTVVGGLHRFSHPVTGIPVLRPRVRQPRFGSPWQVDVVAGPDVGDFTRTADRLVDHDYEVAPASDAVGLRLSGAAPERDAGTELLSRGVAIGSVEVPPSGELLVLQRSRLVTAGYPVIAVATMRAQARLGQVRPGERVRFGWTTLEQARSDALTDRAAVDDLARAVRTILHAIGVLAPDRRPEHSPEQ